MIKDSRNPENMIFQAQVCKAQMFFSNPGIKYEYDIAFAYVALTGLKHICYCNCNLLVSLKTLSSACKTF